MHVMIIFIIERLKIYDNLFCDYGIRNQKNTKYKY